VVRTSALSFTNALSLLIQRRLLISFRKSRRKKLNALLRGNEKGHLQENGADPHIDPNRMVIPQEDEKKKSKSEVKTTKKFTSTKLTRYDR
jgi:hypothetical protein